MDSLEKSYIFSAKQVTTISGKIFSQHIVLPVAFICFFIDETGCNGKDHTRKFGYALRGNNVVGQRWLHRGTRISAITAMTYSGIP